MLLKGLKVGVESWALGLTQVKQDNKSGSQLGVFSLFFITQVIGKAGNFLICHPFAVRSKLLKLKAQVRAQYE